jgi:hypothetical protein
MAAVRARALGVKPPNLSARKALAVSSLMTFFFS